jgi:hypothetical protein
MACPFPSTNLPNDVGQYNLHYNPHLQLMMLMNCFLESPLWVSPFSSLCLFDDHSYRRCFKLGYKEILSSHSHKYVEGVMPSLQNMAYLIQLSCDSLCE